MNDLNNIKKENDLQFTRYLLQLLRRQGGATLNSGAYHISTFENGFQVSIKDLIKIDLNEFNYNDNDIIKFLYENIMKLYTVKQKNFNIGLWLEENTLYIDYSVNIKDYDEAMKTAKSLNQKAVYDWSNKKSIYL